MLFFLFRKNHIFWLFLFSKKFIISHEKLKKTINLNSKTKWFSAKSQKNKHHLSLTSKLDSFSFQEIHVILLNQDICLEQLH